MPLLPVYGHTSIRHRLSAAASDGRLPASILLQGARGVGKQRLALWLGQYLLCDNAIQGRLGEPCGSCQHCRYAIRGTHPDLHWFFPRPRLKDGDASAAEVEADLSEAINERVGDDGLWPPVHGAGAPVGIYMATVLALLKMASLRPAMAKRSVFVVGDAEKMVSQEGADQAANAFLKLLEEPPEGTTLILTTSEPGALLPTIRSRVVSVRVPRLSQNEIEEFLDDPAVVRRFANERRGELIVRAHGAPGALLASDSDSDAFKSAGAILEAALAGDSPEARSMRIAVAARQGVSGARGSFAAMLDALSVLLGEHTRQLLTSDNEVQAQKTASTLMAVEEAKLRANGNVSPQLITASLLADLHQILR